MTFKLPEHIEKKYREAQQDLESKRRVFRSLSNEDLVTSAKFWMAHCQAPKQVEPGEPIYDSTFWHAIIPELLERVRKLEAEKCTNT